MPHLTKKCRHERGEWVLGVQSVCGEKEEMLLGSERLELVQNLAECWFNFPCCLRMAFDSVFLGQTLEL